jgi:hypothetical protein
VHDWLHRMSVRLYRFIVEIASHFIVDIDDCASNPCQHNGVCSDLTNGFVCTCDDGFYGTLCEIGRITITVTVCVFHMNVCL